MSVRIAVYPTAEVIRAKRGGVVEGGWLMNLLLDQGSAYGCMPIKDGGAYWIQ